MMFSSQRGRVLLAAALGLGLASLGIWQFLFPPVTTLEIVDIRAELHEFGPNDEFKKVEFTIPRKYWPAILKGLRRGRREPIQKKCAFLADLSVHRLASRTRITLRTSGYWIGDTYYVGPSQEMAKLVRKAYRESREKPES